MKAISLMLCIITAVFAVIYTLEADKAQDLNAFASGVLIAFSSIVAAAFLAGMLVQSYMHKRRNNRNKNLSFVQL